MIKENVKHAIKVDTLTCNFPRRKARSEGKQYKHA
jgi:hypothetical protein